MAGLRRIIAPVLRLGLAGLLAWNWAWAAEQEGVAPAAPAPVPTMALADRPMAITVALDDNYPPYIFRDADGRLQGILKDSWDLWQRKTGIPVQLLAMDWGKAQEVMQGGGADVIDTLFKTDARRQVYEFSQPYAQLDVVIAFDREISGISDAASLRGFTVGVKAGDACVDYLRGRGVDQLRYFPSYESMILAGGSRELRVFCIDKPPASYYLYKYGLEEQFRFTRPFYTGEFHRAVRKGDLRLLALVEDGFRRISPEERRAIEQKWLGEGIESPWRNYVRYGIHALWISGLLVLGLVLWNRALSRRVAAHTAALAASEKRYHGLFEMANDAILILDGQRILDCNHQALKLYGGERDAIVGHSPAQLSPPSQPDGGDSGEGVAQSVERALSGKPQVFEWQIRRLDGGLVDVEVSLSRFEAAHKPLLQAVIRDLTERKRAEAEIAHLSFFDPLTHLPNRRQLYDRLRQALANCQRQGTQGAALLIDLDHFRTLNDTRGLEQGDHLLTEVARRLMDQVRHEAFLARSGGDEFVVVVENLGSDSSQAARRVEALGERLLEAIAEPYPVADREHVCTASIGVTLFRGFDETADELMKRADAALYRAKTAGRNTVAFFDPAIQAALEARAVLESELRLALPQGELELHYQPLMNAAGRVMGAEALLRWRHPERGLVPPGQFIPFAEESGLIVPIGYWVIEVACARLARWAGRPETRDLYLAVNVSARQFRQPDFVTQVKGVLEQTRADPGHLKLELTETLVLDNVTDSIDKMNALKALGVGFSMDDFGTGYSSLSYLKRLPLDQLKIDQSFVRDIARDPNDAVIVQTIIGMARNLGLQVVAEGVETEEQKDFLLRNGCTGFQGYLFGRPQPVEIFEAILSGAD